MKGASDLVDVQEGDVPGSLKDVRLLMLLDSVDDDLIEHARAASRAGLEAVEVLGPEATEAVRELLEAKLGLVLGAGEISTAGGAWEAVEAGARFIAATPLTGEIAAVCEAADVRTVAVIEDAAAVEAALPLRPDYIRLPARSAALAPMPEGEPNLILEVDAPDEAMVRVALGAGASIVAIRSGNATSPELGKQLQAIVRGLSGTS